MDDPMIPLNALPTIDGQGNLVPAQPIPAVFPARRENLFSLSSANVDALLQYYDLPTDGIVEVRRVRLASHLGLPPER
jgi:hypothetical protein